MDVHETHKMARIFAISVSLIGLLIILLDRIESTAFEGLSEFKIPIFSTYGEQEDTASDQETSTENPYSCHASEFRCNDGECIPGFWRCDGGGDCADWSDEKHCAGQTCPDSYVKCNMSDKCIPKAWECDGVLDCGMQDNTDEDERKCTTENPRDFSTSATEYPRDNCHDWQFRCDNGLCIYKVNRCDGRDHCGDNSDEKYCSHQATAIGIQHATVRPLITDSHVRCNPWQFRCRNGNCITESDRCDSLDDCGDLSDEQGCTEWTTGSAPIPVNHRRTCYSWQFRCDNGLCISPWHHCNGIDNCRDYSDERDCSDLTTDDDVVLQAVCDNGDTIDYLLLCDGTLDCSDGSDETHCGLAHKSRKFVRLGIITVASVTGTTLLMMLLSALLIVYIRHRRHERPYTVLGSRSLHPEAPPGPQGSDNISRDTYSGSTCMTDCDRTLEETEVTYDESPQQEALHQPLLIL